MRTVVGLLRLTLELPPDVSARNHFQVSVTEVMRPPSISHEAFGFRRHPSTSRLEQLETQIAAHTTN
jgi:hypothetical protein